MGGTKETIKMLPAVIMAIATQSLRLFNSTPLSLPFTIGKKLTFEALKEHQSHEEYF
jgi:hypothetical protein